MEKLHGWKIVCFWRPPSELPSVRGKVAGRVAFERTSRL
jgi:hypothetical protein